MNRTHRATSSRHARSRPAAKRRLPVAATPVALTLVALTLAALAPTAPAVAQRAALRSPAATVYTETLATLAAGDPDGALRELVESESILAPEGAAEELESLQTGQMAVARRLSTASSEILVPLAVLHEQAYLRHLAAGDLRLAVRSRRHAVELVELYIEQSPRPDANRLSSALLTSLGGHLQQSTMDNAATALYRRALDLDDTNATARLGLASLLERQGRYEEVLSQLEPLVRAGDRSPSIDRREATLRFGVNLFRLGRVEEGRTALEQLLAEPGDDWFVSLAYQELAREAAGHGETDRAFTLLEEGAARLPDDPSLAVQLAWVGDRTGDPSSTARLRRALDRSASTSGPSPRALYASASGAALTELRRENADEAARRLQPLEDALARREGDRGGPS